MGFFGDVWNRITGTIGSWFHGEAWFEDSLQKLYDILEKEKTDIADMQKMLKQMQKDTKYVMKAEKAKNPDLGEIGAVKQDRWKAFQVFEMKFDKYDAESKVTKGWHQLVLRFMKKSFAEGAIKADQKLATQGGKI